MKHISVLALFAAVAMPFGAVQAAPVSNLHTSGVITKNIATMQHSILLNSIDKFGAATNLDAYSDYTTSHVSHEKCPVVYGKMKPYGEYGDDGTVFKSGRSGGEIGASNYNWFDWQHAQDKAEFKDFDKIDSRYDIISMGFSNEPQHINGGYSQFGGFGGLIIASEKNDDFKTSELGGFIGLFKGYHWNGFNLVAAGDLGALFSDAKSAPGKFSFTNFWLGAGLDASYDIKLAEYFTLQPGVYGGYTWIYSTGYQTETGADISIDSLHNFEVSPALRAITRLGNGWYGTLSGRYVLNFDAGGDAEIAGAKIPELELKDYAEYGLGIEKNMERFGIGVSVGRRDGGRTGWIGDLHIKYIF